MTEKPMDKQKQIEYFEGLLAQHGLNFKALDWNSSESQKLRFQIFEELFLYGFKRVNLSLLDVGSGLGDLFGYLKNERLLETRKISYTGYDIAAKLVVAAKQQYPDGNFSVVDVLEQKELPRFDYVFASGIFNMRTTDKETHLDYVRQMLTRFFELANCGVAVNFLSEAVIPYCDKDDYNSGRYFFFNQEDVLKMSRSIASRYIFRHDYHPGDFSVYLIK